MDTNNSVLRLTRIEQPGQKFEMIARQTATGRIVEINRIGRLGTRNVAFRNANKERPIWVASGDGIEFAGQVWTPEDHDAAVAWMRILDGYFDRDSASPLFEPDALRNPASTASSTTFRQRLTSLSSAGSLLQIAALLVGILGLVGGVVIAFQTDYDGFSETRPYVATGISIAVSSAFTALMAYVLGSLAVAYAMVNLRDSE